MKKREFRIAKQKLYEIINKNGTDNEGWQQLVALAKELNAPFAPGHNTDPLNAFYLTTQSIHTVLQTEMMLNACKSARTSSIAAAVAAALALVTVILTIITICSN